MLKHNHLASIVLALSVSGSCLGNPTPSHSSSQGAVQPTQVSAPTSALFSPSPAADYSTRHGGRAVLILQSGQTIFERYDNNWSATRPHPLASGTKSFTGIIAMFAVQDGLLTLDELASDTITEWKSDPDKSRITVRHLLTLSSGLDPLDAVLGGRGGSRLLGEGARRRAERLKLDDQPRVTDHYQRAIDARAIIPPGERFRYGPSHFYAFAALLERKLAKSDLPHKTVLDYLHARLFDPIGLKVAFFGRDQAGRPNMPGGCLLTAREWAKFGEFVRLNGSWPQPDGTPKQLLKPELLAECFKPSSANARYGLTWWLGGGDQTGQADGEDPAAAAETRERRQLAQIPSIRDAEGRDIRVWMAAGLGKQRLYILPDHDLVIVRFAEATLEGQRFCDEHFLRLLLTSTQVTKPEAPAP